MNLNPEKSFFFFKGRVALYAILRAMGIGPGDEVILPGFTCVVVPNAITYLGAKPVYIDIDAKTYNIDPEKIEHEKGKSWNIGKAKAIIAQHTFGIPADMDEIIEIAKRYNLYVIEDSCHAIGSRYKGKEVGTLGDAAFFSSQWSKPVTTGLGGWAVVNNQKIRNNIKKIYADFINPVSKEVFLLRLQHSLHSLLLRPSTFWLIQNWYRALSNCGILIGSSSKVELECKIPENYQKKMSSWQRSLLTKELQSINQYIDHRKLLTLAYESILEEKGKKPIALHDDYECVFLRYPLLVKNKNKILEKAKKMKVEIGDWFLSPIHPKISEWYKVNYSKGLCPISESICEHIINLPLHQQINEQNIDTIFDLLDDF